MSKAAMVGAIASGVHISAPALIAPPGMSPSNVLAWYDADDATTFAYSSGSVISQWGDKSGAGRHLTPDSTGTAPSRTGSLNGLAAVASPNKALHHVSVPDIHNGVQMTWAVAFQMNGGNRILSFNTTGGLDHETPGGCLLGVDFSVERVGGTGVGVGGDNSGDPHVVIVTFDGTNRRIYMDGVLEATGADTGTFDINQINVGVNAITWDTSDSVYGEIALANVALTGTDLDDLTDYLMAKWVPPSIFTDDFAGTGALSANWVTGGFSVASRISGEFTSNGDYGYAALVGYDLGSGGQYAEITKRAEGSFQLGLGSSTSDWEYPAPLSGYFILSRGDGVAEAYARGSSLGYSFIDIPPIGTRIRAEHDGAGNLALYHDGVLIRTWDDPEPTPMTGPRAWLNISPDTARADDYECGNL